MSRLLSNPYVWGAVGGIIAAAVAWVFLWYGPSQFKAGEQVAAARAFQATIEQLKERGVIDDDVQKTDIADICFELGGLPDDCEQ